MTIEVVMFADQNRLVNGTSGGSCSTKTPLKPLPDHGRHTEVCKNGKSKKPLVQISKVNPLLSQLKHTTNGMEAFIILFQRLTADVSV